MFEVPADVPHISELSIKKLWFFHVILDKIIWVNKLTHRVILQSRITDLNCFLKKLRDRDLDAEEWKFEEVQNYMNHCCYTIWIPSVRIISDQFFNLEQAEAVLFTWKADQDSVHQILHYVWLVLFQILFDDVERGLDTFE